MRIKNLLWTCLITLLRTINLIAGQKNNVDIEINWPIDKNKNEHINLLTDFLRKSGKRH